MTRNTVAGGIIFHSVKDAVLLDMSFFTISVPNIIVVPP
jgi:hypothetical protein